MLSNWRQRLMRGWGLMRLFRLGLAVLVLIEAWKNTEILFGILGGILLFQSLLDIGCCGSGGCEINYPKAKERPGIPDAKEVTFEELK
jgi:hypothetical protein